MFRTSNFKNREVINIDTAERIGMVKDVEIDTANGNIKSVIVRKYNGILPVLWNNEMIIPWENISVMGNDVVLVSIKLLNSK